jgi:hypothetical protein
MDAVESAWGSESWFSVLGEMRRGEERREVERCMVRFCRAWRCWIDFEVMFC